MWKTLSHSQTQEKRFAILLVKYDVNWRVFYDILYQILFLVCWEIFYFGDSEGQGCFGVVAKVFFGVTESQVQLS